MAWNSFFGAMGSAQGQASQQETPKEQSQNSGQYYEYQGYQGTTLGYSQGGSGMNGQIDWGAIADMNREAFSTRLLNIKPKSKIEQFVDSLATINPKFIKEIVVPEEQYYGLVHFFDLKGENSKESLNYTNGYGNILIKNEAYQFDLDKYLEYGPVEEVINE